MLFRHELEEKNQLVRTHFLLLPWLYRVIKRCTCLQRTSGRVHDRLEALFFFRIVWCNHCNSRFIFLKFFLLNMACFKTVKWKYSYREKECKILKTCAWKSVRLWHFLIMAHCYSVLLICKWLWVYFRFSVFVLMSTTINYTKSCLDIAKNSVRGIFYSLLPSSFMWALLVFS